MQFDYSRRTIVSATTTLKLPETLKKRTAFVTAARAAEEEVERIGKDYAFDDVHRCIRALARGRKARRPKPVK